MMSELACSVNRTWWAADAEPPVPEVMTELEMVEADVLTWLEANGPTSLRHLIRESDHPGMLVAMAIDPLVRAGFVQVTARDPDLMVTQAAKSPERAG